MKYTELSFGNVVYDTVDREIIQIDADCLSMMGNYHRSNHPLTCFAPVDITPETLLKLGFHSPDPVIYGSATSRHQLRLSNTKIKHVHQLQNVWTALNGSVLKWV